MEEGRDQDQGEISRDPVVGHRLGYLVSERLAVDGMNRPVGVIFRCECGKLVKISLMRIRSGDYRDSCEACWKELLSIQRRCARKNKGEGA